ncbi:hypothetical protein GCM10011491_42730 [Brucella endophytica]|uniref:Uncharacterized protein n=1 Tax=Brucella endophytica TaxID=1963359 RepID=A0A916SPU5_9HYPH|nr:hypothetical protein [Brucella endophytica]GGB10230.1 hypothetical protein GCM10011491_42730 [Brucella endophytica]
MGVIASLGAGVLDLPTLLPVGGGVLGSGGSLLRTATGAAIGAGIDASVTEAGLHLTQVARTGEESVFNVGGSILLGGALGTLAARYLSNEASSILSRKIEGQERGYDEFDNAFIAAGKAASAGAAARDTGPLALKDEALIKNIPLVNQQDPLIRLQLSDLDTARQTVRGLAETPLEYADNARGVATEIGGSVETRMKMWNAPLAKSLTDIDTLYARYFNDAPDPSAWQARLSPIRAEMQRITGGTKLTYKQFKEEVGKAAFSAEQHPISTVAEAATVYRRTDEAMKKAAIEAGLLPEDVQVQGDVSHLFRMYNKNKIIARRNEFASVLQSHMLAKRGEAENRLAQADASKVAVKAHQAQEKVRAVEQRMEATELRISQKEESYRNVLSVKPPKGKIGVTEKQFEALQRRRDALDDLRSEYRVMEEEFQEVVEKYRSIADEFDAPPDDIKNSSRVKMAIDYVRAKKAEAELKAKITRLKSKEKYLRLSGQKLKADNAARELDAIEVDLARNSKQVKRLEGIFEKTGKYFSDSANAKADEFALLSDDEIRDLVDETIDTILGNADGRIPYDGIISGPRGPLKERTLNIESAKIQDFLELDIEQVLQAQVRTMSADVEIAKKFGDPTMAEEIRKVNDEANRKIAQVDGRSDLDAAAKEKERTRLDKQRKAAVRDIEGIRDRLRGQYALPSNPDGVVLRAGRVARNLNYLRLLGGMKVSAIPDMGRVITVHGMTSAFRDGFLPMMRNFRAFRAAAEEVKQAGTALDMILDTRAMAIADITGEFGRHSKFERGIQSLSSRFGVVSLMAPWNASMKQFAGLVTMSNVLQAAQRVAAGAASPKDIRRLAASGIDEDIAQRIAKEFAQHGDNQDGVLLAKAAGWSDKQAREAFRAAVVRDVDRIVVTPGQDKPLWMSTELGKTIGQFKSFGLSSMQRVTLTGLQQRDAAVLNGILVSLALGAVSYWAKQTISGQPLSDNPWQWGVEAFDRSGLTGWLMEVNNLSEKATRGRVGASLLTGEQVSRYASRNVTSAFLGPTPGAIADIFQVSGSIFAGDTTKSDLRKAREMIPMQNLFYLRRLFNMVEEGTGNALGLPDTRK